MNVYFIRDVNTGEYLTNSTYSYITDPYKAKMYKMKNYAENRILRMTRRLWNNKRVLEVVTFDMTLDNGRVE